ncbi:methylated-DNA-protein-cysteine methyltransferase related protein [Pseudoalteromonas citrea]|uniref:Methylated-DNA-protein-cysteine methyltransferase related protein n=2 Tax=Pseudoalteromonas citrea TaxID=43655 RepID=A0AAD4AEQ7_9GAMM|nr:MGMT family protein [Pseudoalteromonas citrea]KAF7764589.1 methylated-DNA-protein-cysteine methyltransferase related protein [Pseudoalteromonas citrea]
MQDEHKQRLFTLIGGIPAGKVAAYGQLADLAGLPRQARAVGRLLKELPKSSTLPWYRVVNSQGKISFPYGSQKYTEQKTRLQMEGVIFIKDKINMRVYQWA